MTRGGREGLKKNGLMARSMLASYTSRMRERECLLRYLLANIPKRLAEKVRGAVQGRDFFPGFFFSFFFASRCFWPSPAWLDTVVKRVRGWAVTSWG